MKGFTNRQVASHFYISTLQNWLIYNNYTVYEEVFEYFESLELYPICDGIKKALVFIEFVLDKRFKEAQVGFEDELNFVLGQLEENEFEKHRDETDKDTIEQLKSDAVRGLSNYLIAVSPEIKKRVVDNVQPKQAAFENADKCCSKS